jgi:Cu+-exporting ATPase
VTVETIEKIKKTTIPENALLAKAEFNIDGMTCAIGCAAKIEKSLVNMNGIKTATVDFENKIATVEYDMGQLNEKKLTTRVLENGKQFKVSNYKEIL